MKGAKRREPQLTAETQNTLEQIRESVSVIAHELDALTEDALRSLGSATGQFGPLENGALWRGVADEAKRIEAIRATRRTGDGEWIAVIDVTRDDPDDPVARQHVKTEHVRCASRKEAIEAGRRLILQEAELLDVGTYVEASLVSALEWRADGG